MRWRRQELEPPHPELRRHLYARLFTGVPVHDMTAGLVGYRTEVLRQINLDDIRPEGYAFLTEMKFTLHRRGATFCEFPIIFCEREAGHSKFSRKIFYEGMRFPPQGAGEKNQRRFLDGQRR